MPLFYCEHSLFILISLRYPAFCAVDKKNDACTRHTAEHFLLKVRNPDRFNVVCMGLD